MVDAYITTMLSKQRSASIELEGNTDNQSSLGVALNMSYLNKNMFSRVVQFQFNVSSGLEFQFKRSTDLPIINTANVRSDMRLVFPGCSCP